MKRTLFSTSIALLVFLVLGVVIASSPLQQVGDGGHTHPRYETAIADLQFVDAMLWGTLDSVVIGTQVATLTNPATATPTATLPRTNTPRPTFTAVPLVTSTPFVFPTPTQETQPEPTALPPMTYATNVSSTARNIRLCPATTCEVVAVLLVGETVVISTQLSVAAEGLRWYPLWNNSGWVSAERLNPYVRYLEW